MAVWILSSCITILSVLLLRAVFRRWLRPTLRYALWLLVLVRLLIPFSVGETIFSAEHLYRAVPKWTVQTEVIRISEHIDVKEAVTSSDGNSQEFLEELAKQYQTLAEHITEARKADIIRLLYLVWIPGGTVVGTVLLASNLHFYRRLRKSRKTADIPELKIPVYVTDTVTSPCLFGFPRPAIYLTTEAAEDDRLRKYILVHEYTHYRTGDHLFAFLRCVCLVLHWYNPLVWLAAALSRQDGEESCDAGTVRRLGEEERYTYGKVLLTLASADRKSSLLSAAAGAVSQSKKQIAGRIHALVSSRKTKLAAVLLLLPLLTVAVMAGYTGIRTERLSGTIMAPDYVKESALAWAEELVTEGNESLQQLYGRLGKERMDPVILKRVLTTDWRISALTPMGVIAPVCGRELEIWEMELQDYSETMRGEFYYLWSYSTDGSGWGTHHREYYLIFDAETKEEFSRYINRFEEPEEFTYWLSHLVRFYEDPNGSLNDSRNIAGLNLRKILHMLDDEADSPFVYVDRVCYKLEPVQEGEGKYGREEIWKVIVNETGEELGRVLYYPEHDDIVILDSR